MTKFIAHFWNGHAKVTRTLNAVHMKQAEIIASSLAKKNNWKKQEVNKL